MAKGKGTTLVNPCYNNCSLGSSTQFPEDIQARIYDHPCYNEEAHYFFARMHLPVALACNIQCHYCNRLFDCVNESRPGVTSQLLTPEQAARKVGMVAALIPELTVVGIAGPGDPLANIGRTLTTFRLVKERYPDLRLCLSTNGLMLPETVGDLAALQVEHVTVTINATDPEIGKELCQWVNYQGKRYQGREAASLLMEKQLEGLSLLKGKRILAKVNSVMVPGINDHHLLEVARQVREQGALFFNILPLIPCPGSTFGDAGRRGPTPLELKAMQDECEKVLPVMRHCRQCRADAIGLLYEDRSQEFSSDLILEQEVRYNLARRLELHEKIRERQQAFRQARAAPPVPRRLSGRAGTQEERRAKKLLVAVASKGTGLVNLHFGHAREFSIYEVEGEEIRLVGVRNIQLYCGGPATCGDDPLALEKIIAMLSDCQALLCTRIGPRPREALEASGITCLEIYAPIPEAVKKLRVEG